MRLQRISIVFDKSRFRKLADAVQRRKAKSDTTATMPWKSFQNLANV